MKSIVIPILCIIFMETNAYAQSVIPHVDFGQTLVHLDQYPGSIDAAQTMSVQRSGVWKPAQDLLDRDSAFGMQYKTVAGIGDSASVAAAGKTMNPTKAQGQAIAKGSKQAKSLQQQFGSINADSIKNLTQAQKVAFAQSLMNNPAMVNAAATAQAQPPVQQDTLFKFMPKFVSLMQTLTSMSNYYSAQCDSTLNFPKHSAISQRLSQEYRDCHDDACEKEHHDRERTEQRAEESRVLTQIEQITTKYKSDIQRPIDSVADFQTKLNDGSIIVSDQLKIMYRGLLTKALTAIIVVEAKVLEGVEDADKWLWN